MNDYKDQSNIDNVENNLNILHSLKDALYSDDPFFLETFDMFLEQNHGGELSLKKVKKVLKELSIKVGYDLESANDYIVSRHSHLTGISYPIFKEDLLNFIMKQIDNLTNVIFVDDNNLRLDPLERKKLQQENPADKDINQEDSRNDRESEIIDNIDLNLLILQRSLFILKKKFEKYQKEISTVYSKNDPNKTKKVTVNKFMNMLKEIFDESKMSVGEIKKPSDVFKVDYIENLNPKIVENITKKIYDFMIQDRASYNQIIKSKKNIKDDVDEEIITVNSKVSKETNLEKNVGSNTKEGVKENVDQFKSNQGKNSSEKSNTTNDKKAVNDHDHDQDNDNSNEKKKPVEGGSESKLNQNKVNTTTDGSKLNSNDKNLEESKNTKKIEKTENKEADKKINENPKKEDQKELGKNKNAKNEESKEAKSKVDTNVNEKDLKKENPKDLKNEKTKNEETIKKEGKKEEKQENEKNSKNDNKNGKKEEIKNDPSKENKKIEEGKEVKKAEVLDKTKTTDGLEIKKEGREENQKDTKNQSDNKTVSSKNNLNNEKDPKDKASMNPLDSNSAIYPNSIPYLYYDSIPLILADFIDKNNQYIILDSSNELKNELRTLFDAEIMQRIGEKAKLDLDEDRANQIKDLLFEKLNFEKNIRNYEDLLVKKKANRENTVFIEKMLDSLRAQLDLVNKRLKNIEDNHAAMKQMSNLRPKSKRLRNPSSKSQIRDSQNKKLKREPNKEEFRHGALKEIFYFYSRQHGINGSGATFDQIKETLDTMNIAEYIKFCTEFKIPLSKEILSENFKKCCKVPKEMTYDEFIISLNNIAVRVNEERIKALHRRLKILKNGKFEEKKVQKQPKKENLISANLEKLIAKSPKSDLKPNQINYLEDQKKQRELLRSQDRKSKSPSDKENEKKNTDSKTINNNKKDTSDSRKIQPNESDINNNKNPLTNKSQVLTKDTAINFPKPDNNKQENKNQAENKSNQETKHQDVKNQAENKAKQETKPQENKNPAENKDKQENKPQENKNPAENKAKQETKPQENKNQAENKAKQETKPQEKKTGVENKTKQETKAQENKNPAENLTKQENKHQENKTGVENKTKQESKPQENKNQDINSGINNKQNEIQHGNNTGKPENKVLQSKTSTNETKQTMDTKQPNNTNLDTKMLNLALNKKDNHGKSSDQEHLNNEKDDKEKNKTENKSNSKIDEKTNSNVVNKEKSNKNEKQKDENDLKTNDSLKESLNNSSDSEKKSRKNSPKKEVYSIKLDSANNKFYYNHKPENKIKFKIPVTSTHLLINSEVPKKREVSSNEDLKEILKDADKKKQEIEKCNQMIDKLNSHKFPFLQESLFQMMQIDNEQQYRSKMNGFVHPFNVHDKNYKIPIDVKLNNLKKMDNRTSEEIKRIIAARKEEKLRIQKEKEQEERLKQYQERRRIQKIYERQKKEFEKVQANENTYATAVTKKKNYEKDKPRQLTWDQLENLNTNYFASNNDDDFNPRDFIDLEQGYDSDDGLLQLENKHGNITNNSTRIHDSINNNSEYSDKKPTQTNNLRSSKSVNDKLASKTNSNKPKPPVNRDSLSKGENRVNNDEMINIHKTDISGANKSVNLDTKNTLDRARVYEKQMEDRKDKMIQISSKQANQGKGKIQKYNYKS